VPLDSENLPILFVCQLLNQGQAEGGPSDRALGLNSLPCGRPTELMVETIVNTTVAMAGDVCPAHPASLLTGMVSTEITWAVSSGVAACMKRSATSGQPKRSQHSACKKAIRLPGTSTGGWRSNDKARDQAPASNAALQSRSRSRQYT
jgi:hypothetical protein